jgi:hypothetical protein
MKILSGFLIAGAMLAGCVSNEPTPTRATTVVVPPSSHSTTVVVPEARERGNTVVVPEGSRTTVICQDGTKPPCY